MKTVLYTTLIFLGLSVGAVCQATPNQNIKYPQGIFLYTSHDGGVYTTEWTAYPISKEDNNIEVLVKGIGRMTIYEIFRINCKNKSDTDVINAYGGEYRMSIEEYMQEFEERRGQMVKNLFKKFCN